ncbi:MAG: MFS transporter [Bacteroidetes bacterium]|nr:MFS transporter [Bacteroidota bacterium]
MTEKNNPSIVRSWTFYDWANSVYSLVIVSSVFPVYYQAVTTASDGSDQVNFLGFTLANSVLLSYAISFSYIVVTPLLPLLSGIADYAGNKKFFMGMFANLGGLACATLYFFDASNLELGIACVVLACIGYSGSVVFYDAYLPEIVTEDKMDSVSARGYIMGYAGSVLLLIFSLVMISNYQTFGFTAESSAVRFVFLLVGCWWILFSQIPLRVLPTSGKKLFTGGQVMWSGYIELKKVWNELKEQHEIRRYLLSYFFFNMGVQTIMYLAATFGSKELQLPGPKLIATVLLIQLVGALGAWGFARVSDRIGNKATLSVMISIWIVICLSAYFITQEYQFYAVACAVGTVMGGIQSLGRATYAKLLPVETKDFASYFSFYDVVYNLSIVFGTFMYGFVEQITGSMRNSTLVLMTFFIAGLYFLQKVNMQHRPSVATNTTGA